MYDIAISGMVCDCVFQNAEALLKEADPAMVQQENMESLRGYILTRLGAHR